jgi:ATP-binding cassette subfamily B protein
MAFILICVFGSLYVINEQMTIGGITAFFTYAMLFMQPIVSLGNITNKLQSSFACAERVFTLLDEEEEVPEETGTSLETINGEVEFRNVSFRYLEDKPLIENMNLHVQPGQLVAIVGPTGGGKQRWSTC